MKRIVVFDLDGTVSDTLSSIVRAVDLTLEKYGAEPLPKEKTEEFIGNGASVLISKAANYRGLISAGVKVEDMLEEFLVQYATVFLDTELYDGVDMVYETLASLNIPVGIYSNKPDKFVSPITDKFFGKESLVFSVGHIPGNPKKPDPTVLSSLLEGVGATNEGSVFVGDSEVDILTAKNAGMISVAVTWGYRPESLLVTMEPDYVAHSSDELCDILKKILISDK